VYSLHFAACTRNIGPWQEYKQGVETYGKWFDPPLRIVDCALSIPQGLASESSIRRRFSRERPL
jgi:hypothetical protein